MSSTHNDLAYDVIVVGAGPAGENVADRAVQGGLSVALVEDELVGGECSYRACMPTKALLRSTAALHAARQLPGAQQAIASPPDVDAVLQRRDRFSSGWKDDGQVSWLQSAQGQTTRLSARHAVVIATGSSALVPPVPGLADVPVWTNPEAAAVGLTAAQSERDGYRTRVVDHDLGSVSGAAPHADGYAGRARMVVDEDRQVILGMTFVGPDVAELLHAATIAIAGEVPLQRLWHAVPAFPTIGEVWLRLLEGYGRPSS